MSLWEERAARNEALFREVNERVASLAGGGATESGFVCECSDAACVERLHLARDEYHAVRQNPRGFILVPGHEGAFERVVERHETYVVVEKLGDAGRISEQHDPRA
jgi:hypothetical protein